jgi:hypothetical protein
MAGFAIRTSFAGHICNSVKAADELTYSLGHLVGAGHVGLSDVGALMRRPAAATRRHIIYNVLHECWPDQQLLGVFF